MKAESVVQTERDLLIRLDTKVEALTGDVKDLKTDLISRMARAETRLDAIEIINAGYKANLRFVAFIVMAISATVGAITAVVLGKFIH